MYVRVLISNCICNFIYILLLSLLIIRVLLLYIDVLNYPHVELLNFRSTSDEFKSNDISSILMYLHRDWFCLKTVCVPHLYFMKLKELLFRFSDVVMNKTLSQVGPEP